MFGNRKLTDEAMILAIQSNGRTSDRAIAQILEREMGKIQALVRQRGGSDADGEDVALEGVTALVLNIRRGSFRGESAISTYLFAICKGIWYKRSQRRQRENEIKDQLVVVETDEHTPAISLMDEEQKGLLHQLFARLREKCSEVLFLWAGGYAMEEIAGQLDYSNAQVAMNKKKKCLKQLHKLMEDDHAVQNMVQLLYART
ncbi:MAG: RNA polymerase sigma factor [Bacteroidota bacterium]